MSGRIVKLQVDTDLTVMALEGAIETYSAQFKDTPYLLIVGDGNYWRAKEILHKADRIHLEVVGWMPSDMWMLTGSGGHGLFISPGA